MTKMILTAIIILYPILGWSAVGSCIRMTTEEGVTVLYEVTSEPDRAPGTVSVGSATDNSYTLCIDPSTEGTVTIPESIVYGGKGYYVNSVANHAFDNCKSITRISLPNRIISVGNWSFYGCESLVSINLPENLITLGKSAFEGCSSLIEINIPEKLKTINMGTFSGCSSLRNLSLNQVNNIGERAFSECQRLDSISFVKSMTIAKEAFYNCNSLTTVSFMASQVTLLSDYIFKGCSNLKYVYSHLSLLAGIGAYTFSDIHPDATLYVDANKISAYENDLHWNVYFKNICKFPLQIGEVFVVDLIKSEVTIKANVEVVSTSPMSLCIKSLVDYSQLEQSKELVIPGTIIDYDNISFIISRIGESSFKESNLHSLTIDEGVEIVETDALKDCPFLESLYIARSVKEIEKAIYGCDNLRSVIVCWRNPSEVYIDKDNFYDISAGAILYVPAGTKELYEQHEVWSRFSQIIESSPISVGDISARVGSAVKLPVFLNNTETIAGIQFKLTFPEGVLADDINDELLTSLTDRTEGMTVMCNKDPDDDNSYLFILFSLEGKPISGNQGSIMDVVLKISDNIPLSSYNNIISEVYLVTSSYETLNPLESSSDIIITEILKGDANGNGGIDIGDAVSIVNHLVGKESSTFLAKAADTNENGQIDIGDAVTIVNLLVGKVESLSRQVIFDNAKEKDPQ